MVSRESKGGSENSEANLFRSLRLGRSSISGSTIVWPVPSRPAWRNACRLSDVGTAGGGGGAAPPHGRGAPPPVVVQACDAACRAGQLGRDLWLIERGVEGGAI